MTGAPAHAACGRVKDVRAQPGRREAVSGGADFAGAGAKRSEVEAAAKLGEPLILEADARRMTPWAF